jgi:hypothetical protein
VQRLAHANNAVNAVIAEIAGNLERCLASEAVVRSAVQL